MNSKISAPQGILQPVNWQAQLPVAAFFKEPFSPGHAVDQIMNEHGICLVELQKTVITFASSP
jgi:hypothetical protein